MRLQPRVLGPGWARHPHLSANSLQEFLLLQLASPSGRSGCVLYQDRWHRGPARDPRHPHRRWCAALVWLRADRPAEPAELQSLPSFTGHMHHTIHKPRIDCLQPGGCLSIKETCAAWSSPWGLGCPVRGWPVGLGAWGPRAFSMKLQHPPARWGPVLEHGVPLPSGGHGVIASLGDRRQPLGSLSSPGPGPVPGTQIMDTPAHALQSTLQGCWHGAPTQSMEGSGLTGCGLGWGPGQGWGGWGRKPAVGAVTSRPGLCGRCLQQAGKAHKNHLSLLSAPLPHPHPL